MADVAAGAIGAALMLLVPGYFVVQPWALITLRGGWRIAAAVPLLIAIPAILFSLVALSQDSNLWPIAFVLFAPIGTLYLLALVFLRRMSW